MADDKIVHRISLEGAEDVANKLKKIGDVSSDAFQKVKQYADDSGSGLANAGNAFATIQIIGVRCNRREHPTTVCEQDLRGRFEIGS
jgi:hypothetical protein